MNLLGLLNLYRAYLSFTGNRKNVRASITLLQEGGSSVTFPVPPADLPMIGAPQNNDVFNSVIGDVSIMGLMGLRTIEFSDILAPGDNSDYSWANGDNGGVIINFINDARLSGQPFRLIISKDDVTYCNMSCLIDDFSYYLDNQCDYHLTIKFTEYRTYNSQTGGLEC